MNRKGPVLIILATFVVMSVSGCIGAGDDAPKGPTIISDTAKGTEIDEFTFEPITISATAMVVKFSETVGQGRGCEFDLPVQCTERTRYGFNWTIEGLPDLATADGGVGEVFYMIWVGKGEAETIAWSPQGPEAAKDGKIEGGTDNKGSWRDFSHFRLSIETKQDSDEEIVLFEVFDLEENVEVAAGYVAPFDGAFGSAKLAPGIKDSQVNLTTTAIGLPDADGAYDAWLVVGTGAPSYLARLRLDAASGGLAATVPVDKSRIKDEWTVYVSYEAAKSDEDPSPMRVLTAKFAL